MSSDYPRTTYPVPHGQQEQIILFEDDPSVRYEQPEPEYVQHEQSDTTYPSHEQELRRGPTIQNLTVTQRQTIERRGPISWYRTFQRDNRMLNGESTDAYVQRALAYMTTRALRRL